MQSKERTSELIGASIVNAYTSYSLKHPSVTVNDFCSYMNPSFFTMDNVEYVSCNDNEAKLKSGNDNYTVTYEDGKTYVTLDGSDVVKEVLINPSSEGDLEPYEGALYFTYDFSKGLTDPSDKIDSNWKVYIKANAIRNYIAETDIYGIKYEDGSNNIKQFNSKEDCENQIEYETDATCELKYPKGSRYDKIFTYEACGKENGKIGKVSSLIEQGVFTSEECTLSASADRCTGSSVYINSSAKIGEVGVRDLSTNIYFKIDWGRMMSLNPLNSKFNFSFEPVLFIQ